jgi:uncharacterized protein (DUF58 family)
MVLKEGDKVRVKATRPERAEGIGWHKDMDDFLGMELTISEIRRSPRGIPDDEHRIFVKESRASSWVWHASYFEPVGEPSNVVEATW